MRVRIVSVPEGVSFETTMKVVVFSLDKKTYPIEPDEFIIHDGSESDIRILEKKGILVERINEWKL